MTISLIAAVDRNNVIGKDGKIPWHLPNDLRRFKKLTMGHPIIMGRKTFESIGKALPGRTNIVLTKNGDFAAEGCLVVHTVPEALRAAKSEEVFVIGGAEMYREFLPLVTKMYLTRVEGDWDGDTYFPPVDMSEWKEVSREEGVTDAKNPHAHAFLVFKRTVRN